MEKNILLKIYNMIDYKKAWDIQEKLFNEIIDTKKKNSNLPKDKRTTTLNHMICCQHNHVYTIGKSFKGNIDSLLINKDIKNKVPFYYINRGGNITYHGPGQIVIYPILNLDYFFNDVNKYLRLLEEAVILTLLEFGIKSRRVKNLTGVWVEEKSELRKICAIGIRTSFWTTMHGLAFNVNTDIKYFNYIIPCGLTDKKTTSMRSILNKDFDIQYVQNVLIHKLYNLLGIKCKILI